MRLVTFNVLHGRSLSDGRVDGVRFAEAVAALDADVLGLQEVDRRQPRSGQLDLTALAAEALGAAEHRFAAALLGTPGETFRAATGGLGAGRAGRSGSDGESGRGGTSGPAGGDDPECGPGFGVALVSRWPVSSWHVTRLPAAPVRSPVYAPGPHGRFLLLRDEPRVLLAAVVRSPIGPLTVATTHLSFVPGWNVVQLRRVVRALRALPGPRVLLGDLNLPTRVAALVSGWRPLARCATYPSVRPRLQLDHVLSDGGGGAGGRRPRVVAASAPVSAVSDHRPLVVELA